MKSLSKVEQGLEGYYTRGRSFEQSTLDRGRAQQLGTSPKTQGYERYEGPVLSEAEGTPLVLPRLLPRNADRAILATVSVLA